MVLLNERLGMVNGYVVGCTLYFKIEHLLCSPTVGLPVCRGNQGPSSVLFSHKKSSYYCLAAAPANTCQNHLSCSHTMSLLVVTELLHSFIDLSVNTWSPDPALPPTSVILYWTTSSGLTKMGLEQGICSGKCCVPATCQYPKSLPLCNLQCKGL